MKVKQSNFKVPTHILNQHFGIVYITITKIMELSLFLSYVSGQGMLILGNVHHFLESGKGPGI